MRRYSILLFNLLNNSFTVKILSMWQSLAPIKTNPFFSVAGNLVRNKYSDPDNLTATFGVMS